VGKVGLGVEKEKGEGKVSDKTIHKAMEDIMEVKEVEVIMEIS